MKKIITLLAIATACLTSCTEDLAKEYSISLESTRLSFDSEGGKQQVSLESTYEWEVSGGDDWCSVSPQSGEGDAEVVFTIDPNMTEDGRSAEFVFTSGNKKTTLTVTQEKKEYSISIEPKELKFGAEGGEQEITVTSSDEWEVKGESDWCEISLTSGNNGDKVTFFADPYENTAEERTTIFTFYCGDKDVDLIVTQEAKEYSISIEPTEIEFEAEGGEQTITITSSDEWEFSSDKYWISASEDNGENGAIIDILVGENEETEPRTGVAMFRCGDKRAEVKITQKAKEYSISIEPTEIEFEAAGGEQTITVTSSDSWEFSSDEYWIQSSEKSGENGASVKIIVDENSDPEIRTGIATFKCGDKQANVKITQEAKEYSISIEPTEIEFEAEGGEQTITVTSSDSWSLSTDNDWITTSIKSGENESLVNIIVDYTTSAEIRTGIITFTCGDKTAEFTVTQNPDNSPIIQFKDPYFEMELLEKHGSISWNGVRYDVNVDKNGDGKISTAEAAAVKVLKISDDKVRNVDELKTYFSSLEFLQISECPLESLDLSGHPTLTKIECRSLRFDVNLSSCHSLKEITFSNCFGNYYNISDCTALTSLDCSDYSKLTSLDVSGCTALTELYCRYSQLTSLDVSGCTALTELDCSDKQLTSLDVSGCTALTKLNCSDNQLTSLDVSGYTALTVLYCGRNQLTSLDVSGCTALTELDCEENQLTSLDVSGCTALTELDCKENQLTSLDVSGCTALTSLGCGSNQLTSLDISSNTALTSLGCGSNQLTSLDISSNTALTNLYCSENQLTSLDVSNNTALTKLRCSDNQLTSLDLSNNRKLTDLDCSKNQLREIILYKYHMLPDSMINNIKKEYGDIITYIE